MDAITRALVDPAWWFTALFAGLVVSISAHFLIKSLEKWLAKTGSQRQMRSKAKQEKWDAYIQKLATNEVELDLAKLYAERAFKKASEGTFLSVIFFLIYIAFHQGPAAYEGLNMTVIVWFKVGVGIVSFLTVILSFLLFQIADKEHKRVHEALMLKRKSQNT